MKIQHIAAKNVTECLAHAMENADKMKHVMVIYETHDDDPNPGGWHSTEGMTIATMNYLLDLGKKWIFYDTED